MQGVTAPGAVLRAADGSVLALAVGRWVGRPTAEDAHVLERAIAPVLDVGCGPGRHTVELAARGVVALGVDASPLAVRLARAAGAPVLERSVFGRVPGAGRWRTALLLDGNVGIGGDPAALLARLRSLLHRRGRVLVEVEPPGVTTRSFRARLERGPERGPWFPWAVVGADGTAALAATAGFACTDVWASGPRWFAQLDGS
jgi:SAM-dependent methyltransferase